MICCLFAAFLTAPGAAIADPAFDAHGSVEQVYATGLVPGAPVSLLDEEGHEVASRTANQLGGTLFRNVTPGGYRVASGGEKSDPLQVLTTQSAPPDPSIYNQPIAESGYQYLTTRDGTKLAIDVHPPSDVTHALPGVTLPPPPSGPTPTLIEYSGYGYANPAGPENGIAIIANLMGFTVVDVNMRGTGCSGGAYDFFEPLQNLDGYDVVETIAHQSWVKGHKVGMMGISYGGISQLFTAATQPPDLAAISPLSVIDNTQTTLYPGGILNTGFALEWAKERVQNAEAADPDSGQAWAYKRIHEEGDTQCEENQALHSEAVDLLHKIEENSHYKPEVADPLSPVTFVNKIDVPTFMACQWTDEQTGGHCPTLAEHMTGTEKKWFTFTNGTHIDSLDPETFNRWFDFLKLYVAEESPFAASPAVQAGAPLVYKEAMGIEGVTLPPDPIQQQPIYGSALAAFEAQKPIRVLFDNGAGKSPLGQSNPGYPYPGFEESFDELPAAGTEAKRWYMAPGGELSDSAPGSSGADEFNWDAGALPKTDFSGGTGGQPGGLWTATPDYHWEQNPAGTAVSYLTPPLGADTTVVGGGAVEAWVRSSTPNVDLQATISEVRPDGKETFVQNGWVRANERKLDAAKSTPLEPVLSLRESDVEPMSAAEFVPVTIPLYYEGHAYRAGSQIRVTIAAPNGTQPIWAFDQTEPEGAAQVAIAYGGSTPSSLLLPVVPGVSVPTELPPCPGLRGEPCRDYQALANPPEGSLTGGQSSASSSGTAAGDEGSTILPPQSPTKKPLKCRKHFKKKRVKGQMVCKKVKRHHHKQHHRRRHH